ncbi:MAG: carbonic anhydrase, partial [Raoultibacter sp.]
MASSTFEKILEHNHLFVEQREFERYETDKYPDKKLAIVSCMDTRLTELLAAALGLKNGDAKIIKVAGAEVAHPFGSVMRSLLIAICELGVEDVMIVAHTNCGAQDMDGASIIEAMQQLGVPSERIELARHCGIDFDRWLAGFGDTEEAVRKSVDMVRNHPVM